MISSARCVRRLESDSSIGEKSHPDCVPVCSSTLVTHYIFGSTSSTYSLKVLMLLESVRWSKGFAVITQGIAYAWLIWKISIIALLVKIQRHPGARMDTRRCFSSQTVHDHTRKKCKKKNSNWFVAWKRVFCLVEKIPFFFPLLEITRIKLSST